MFWITGIFYSQDILKHYTDFSHWISPHSLWNTHSQFYRVIKITDSKTVLQQISTPELLFALIILLLLFQLFLLLFVTHYSLFRRKLTQRIRLTFLKAIEAIIYLYDSIFLFQTVIIMEGFICDEE